MARAAITKSTAPGNYPTAGVEVTWTAANVSDKNDFVFTGAELLLVHNTHATLAKTWTLSSIANAKGRTKDITAESLTAGLMKVVGPFRQKEGWQQSGGKIHVEGESTDIKFAVITLPNG